MSERRSNYYSSEEIITNLVIPPDGGWGWFIVFSSFLNIFLVDGVNFTFGIYISTLSEEFDKTVAETVMLGSMMGAISYLIGPFVSALLNNYDFRFVAIIGTFCATGGYIGASFATNYWFFFCFYSVLGGFGYGLMLLPALIAPNCYFLKWRALACCTASCGSGIGILILPPFTTFLLEHVKWRNTLRIMGGIVLVFGLFGSSYKPLKPQTVISQSKQRESDGKPSMSKRRRRRCCVCCAYSNKYYPTTSEVVPTGEALLEKFDPTLEPIKSSMSVAANAYSARTSRRIMSVFSVRPSLISTNFTRCSLWYYNCLYIITCQLCLIDAKAFNRDDAFYDNSISLIPKYRKYAINMKKKLRKHKKNFKGKKLDAMERKLVEDEKKLHMEYNMEMTRVTVNEEHWWKPHSCCSLSCLRTLATLLHCDLFSSSAFFFLILAALSYSLGFGTTLMYLRIRAAVNGIPNDKAVWLLSIIGGSLAVGRIVSGILPCVVHIYVPAYVVCTVGTAGLVIIGSNFLFYYWFQVLCCVLYGFNSSTYVALRTIINLDLFGIENLNNVFGIQLMFVGIGMLLGPVIGGFLYDCTKTYFWSYMYCGGCLVCCAIFTGMAKLIRMQEIKKEEDEDLYETDIV